MIYQGQEIDTKPTQEMAQEAEKGLAWREEYRRGGTLVGVARANQLRRRDELSIRTIKRMKAYFDRHAIDLEAPKNRDPDAEGYPGAGLIAWLLWGGDSGKAWADRKVSEILRIEDGN